MSHLSNVVALVTGASRGAGRGIALELGAAGATVYVTARSISGRPTTDNVPGMIDEAFRRAGAPEALDRPGGPSETPAYVGRAIVALAADPRVIGKSGQLVDVGALAREYGFTDINGTQPPPFRIPAST